MCYVETLCTLACRPPEEKHTDKDELIVKNYKSYEAMIHYKGETGDKIKRGLSTSMSDTIISEGGYKIGNKNLN